MPEISVQATINNDADIDDLSRRIADAVVSGAENNVF